MAKSNKKMRTTVQQIVNSTIPSQRTRENVAAIIADAARLEEAEIALRKIDGYTSQVQVAADECDVDGIEDVLKEWKKGNG